MNEEKKCSYKVFIKKNFIIDSIDYINCVFRIDLLFKDVTNEILFNISGNHCFIMALYVIFH